MTVLRLPGHTCPAIDVAIRAARHGNAEVTIAALETVRAENVAMRAAYWSMHAACKAAGVEVVRVFSDDVP